MLLAAACALAACGGQASEEPETKAGPRTVTVARVELRPLVGGVTGSGMLAAREEAAVGSEIGGFRVADVLAEEGDSVRAGQTLVRIDPTLLRAQITQLSANLAQQRTQAAQAEREANRVAGLDGEGILSQEAIEQRRAAAQSARAAVRAAEGQLQELTTRLARLTIVAPVSGRVLERTVRPGDIATGGGEPMFRIARGGQIELLAEIPEAELATIRPGQPVEVRLPSGETITGSVRLVEPEVNEQTRLGVVRVALPNRDDLRVGGFATASFTAAGATVPAVPEDALRYDAEGVHVITVDRESRARRAPVRTGRRAAGWVELVEGPPVGTPVLRGGGAFVLEGEQVRPARPAAGARPKAAPAQQAPRP
ncbi:efflux RND transporter periplasmic adaptor subunit [Sphingosinicella sp. CPCC 101087]|uniref:efflux RND transporter periplasmic adaptor subunit n=1 Tax=Sphingosinicella sp. CPCC 101087 TaxID=2497754 RepID=UPI001980F327|nr:efflux RND transporter periplasmic adaptor subunit [Sphingosinicella sp. CPCC 101087]